MKIQNVEVKTNYIVEIEFKDFADAKEKWLNKDSVEYLMFKDAFDNEDMTLGTLKKEMKEFSPNKDRNDLLVHCLGFDGWTHALLYRNNKLTLGVYKRGDTMNN